MVPKIFSALKFYEQDLLSDNCQNSFVYVAGYGRCIAPMPTNMSSPEAKFIVPVWGDNVR
jgi:hypothetical protein